MKNLLYITFLCTALACSFSCVKKNEHSLRGEARELYVESKRIATLYLDSMAGAKDSVTLFSLCERYDEEITRLNYAHAAGADYEISEGENDTLTNLNSRFIILRDSLLRQYARTPLPIDSRPSDSIPHP